MQTITALVKTSPESIAALRRAHPEVFATHAFALRHYESDVLFIDGFFRSQAELVRFLNRLVGEHEVIDSDTRPVTPPN